MIFNPETLRKLRVDLNAELAAVGQKLGIKLQVGSASFTETVATFKLEVAALGADGTADSKIAVDFRNYATMFGLKAEDLGREFSDGGHVYKVAGCMPRSSRFPIVCERGGKQYKLPADRVKRALSV